MKKFNLFAILSLMIGIATVFSSCNETTNTVASTAALTITSVDESQAAIISDNIDNEIDAYVSTEALYGIMKVGAESNIAKGPIVTVDKPDSANFPKKFTIDYGTTGFLGKRGNILKGKLIVVVSNNMWKAGSTKTINYDNFSINDNMVKGSKVLTYKGLNADKHPYWNIMVNDTISRGDTVTVVWNSNRNREWINDNDTPLLKFDDNYSISGTSNGVNAKGVAYSIEINKDKPLFIGGLWPYFVKGEQTISSEKRTAIIDFGDGTKDKLATVTIDGVSKEITLKR